MSSGHTWIIAWYGLVPSRLLDDPPGEAFTSLTSMFMHASWGHIGWNMVFLYIFGDNIEDTLGHFRYIVFYLLAGFGAAAAQVLIDPSSSIPMVGASGAIAGVLGAYLVYYPKAPVLVLNPIPPLWLILGLFISLPAWLVIGEWFVGNLLGGMGALAGRSSSVAFFAHIGGFLTGLVLARPFRLRPPPPPSTRHGLSA